MPHDPNKDDATVRYTVLSPRVIAAWAVLIVLVGVGVAVWLLLGSTGGDAAANSVRLDAIRTAGTVVVAAGGAAALLLAARRQRSTEIALKQKDRDQVAAAAAHALQEQVAEQNRLHQERVAAATEADAEARRITDLYTKAVEQIGSDKAPVRLGGMYALERLAQDNESQRQTISNVFCAYLRMPYRAPGDPPGDDDLPEAGGYWNRVQELEVRNAAQRILAAHLRPGPDAESPATTFWPDIDLDLTGATLVDLDLDRCRLRAARFTNARFTGHASLVEIEFTGGADFTGADFGATVACHEARFLGVADFDDAQFTGRAVFSDATFGPASFARATFACPALFRRTRFTRPTWFHEAQFGDAADFRGARFADMTGFIRTTFAGNAEFREAHFADAAQFDRSRFAATAWFREVSFYDAHFGGAKFSRDARFDGAQFAGYVDFNKAQFMGVAGFIGSHFTKGVTFEVAHFDADARFGRTIFLVDPRARGATFKQAVPPKLAPFTQQT